MQGKKLFLDQEVVRFRLSERVRPHNLYRRLAELVDWSFLYEETRALYSHTGQPSLDPVVFFQLVLVGRLENLVRDRRLVEHCALRGHPLLSGLRGGRGAAVALDRAPHPPAVSGRRL
ncbi:MAG TPA: hypothetical protein VF629_24935 [Hymenobacter sp.]|jgi:hypothetical protein|uniref:hypothetical protein n=1 Tax=Hymenobacter sp. TaxID=1898978 RepID=UPI002EDB4CFD